MLKFSDMPARVAALDRDRRGYPIPYFVARPADGTIDYRIMHPEHRIAAVKRRLCWVCGQPLGRLMVFVGGPLSAAQRVYVDPPSHRDCAEFAVRACPFLAIPTAHRRQANMPDHIALPGNTVQANPEVFGILVTKGYTGHGMLHADVPIELVWYREGRAATRVEVMEAIHIARSRDELNTSPLRPTILKMLDQLPLP